MWSAWIDYFNPNGAQKEGVEEYGMSCSLMVWPLCSSCLLIIQLVKQLFVDIDYAVVDFAQYSESYVDRMCVKMVLLPFQQNHIILQAWEY